MPMAALIAALITFTAACSDDECVDEDDDGYGEGPGCEARDCDDSDSRHHADCLSCSDPDDDGYGTGCDLGKDCAPSNGRHWADCGNCTDVDIDGYGPDCDLGVDCDDNDPDQFTNCGGCADADGDGSYGGCDAFTNRPGPDCDDADPDNFLRCDYCTDGDGDGRFTSCDRYVEKQADCDDTDVNNWTACGLCRDRDADGYSSGCDQYTGALKGPDCNDVSALHWSDCTTCSDLDNDGRGPGCDLGNDCNNSNRDAWTSCSTCLDADADRRWVGCDAYVLRDSLHAGGPDCNDADPNSWSMCGTCFDADVDGYWRGCDTYTTAKPGPDCNDADVNNWNLCASCRDNDMDTYFNNCDTYGTIQGPDCSDSDRNNWTSCSTCVDTDGDGRYAGCNTYVTIPGPDCAPTSNLHWSDCGLCVDNDNDGRGMQCDLGTDCNDGSNLHWSDCLTCTDLDFDGYGTGTCDLGGGDCDDNNNARNPGATDATVNGIDENCNGIDGPGFFDNFEDGVYAPQWTFTSGDTHIAVRANGEYTLNNSNYGLNLGGAIGEVQSTFIDTSICTGGVAWRYYVKRGPETPDASLEDLELSYWTGTAWVAFDTAQNTSFDDPQHIVHQGTLTATNARHTQFRLRFRTLDGSGTGFDDYWIDDVSVGCAVDTDLDGTIDPFDCAPADPDHWSDCGMCVDVDMDDFGTNCNLGVDCDDNNAARSPRLPDTTQDGVDQNCDNVDGPFSSVSMSTPLAITDNTGDATDCTGATLTSSPIVIADSGTLFDVDVRFTIAHVATAELDVFLHYTNGTDTRCIELTTDNGSGSNYTATVLSDEGATNITAGANPFTGTFAPEQVSPNLNGLENLPRAGTYTLRINDDTAGNAGTLTSWGMTIRYF